MLSEQRIKKIIKQIAKYEKNIDFENDDKFIHNKQKFYFEINFDNFCADKIFFIELGVNENHFFKGGCLIEPAYEIVGKPVNLLNLKDVLWIKFNLNENVTNILSKTTLTNIMQLQNYVEYRGDVHFAWGEIILVTDMIMGALLKSYVY